MTCPLTHGPWRREQNRRIALLQRAIRFMSKRHHITHSPIPASSGKTVRHRLNRGGDRSANNALWTIAMVRMRSDSRTRAYVARRTAEGLSSKEIQRCLKRYIIRDLYPLILADLNESRHVG